MIVFDSYAWIEYFAGSAKGKKVKKIINSTEIITTPSICLAEIKRKYLREKKEYEKRIKFIISRSKVIVPNTEIMLLAGNLAEENKIYIIDAIVYASAKILDAKLLTADKHFQNLPNVELL